NPTRNSVDWRPHSWREGNKNVINGEFQHLSIEKRSIALISHDGKKHEMVDFIMRDNHLELLARHDRILATGTTGWLLKLLFCDDIEQYRDEIKDKEQRLCGVISDILDKKDRKPPKYANLDKLLDVLRKVVSSTDNTAFSEKVMPLPSGPDGGDVIAADEILNNKLHEVIFFQDPMEAHPHAEDIRLFERTARLPGVFSECVSDEESADQWMEGLQKEIDAAQQRPTVSQRLRSRFGLREAILIDIGTNRDGPELGTALARACAGYLNQWLHAIDASHTTRIGVAWGWGLRQVLAELH